MYMYITVLISGEKLKEQVVIDNKKAFEENKAEEYMEFEEEYEVEVDIDEYIEIDKDDKISYIEGIAVEQYERDNSYVRKVSANVSQDDISELEQNIEDIYDISDMTGDEDFDEFMEHEDY